MYTGVLYVYMSSHCMYAWCPGRPGVGSPGTGGTDGCELPMWVLGSQTGVLWDSYQGALSCRAISPELLSNFDSYHRGVLVRGVNIHILKKFGESKVRKNTNVIGKLI